MLVGVSIASVFFEYEKYAGRTGDGTPRQYLATVFRPTLAHTPPVAEEAEATVLFVGDMMFDRYIRQVTERQGGDFLFSCIEPLLQEADLVVGNLEGPITVEQSVSVGSVIGSPNNFRFTFPLGTANLLLQHHIQIVNIGNNHIDNFGREGIASTRDALTKAGVSYFGDIAGENMVYQTEVQGVGLSFINYNQFGGASAEKVAERITSEHLLGRKVIVYTHWGEEYIEVTGLVRGLAKLFAEHGADIIIGSHPHVIQSNEKIGNTLVYYSLGNFIFDQYWEARVTKGLTLLVHISKDQITVDERPVTLMPDGRTCPATQ